jgi:endoglucanase
MDSDILIHHPTHAVIKLGMNDVMRKYYGAFPTTNADTLRLRENAINTYKVKFDSIVNIFLKRKIKVILQKPTIYDQTATIKKENNFGVNDALKTCADYIQTLADKYQLPLVDYWTILNNINTNFQRKETKATIIGQDRVHPGADGHLIMAYQFLKTTNAPKYVAQIRIDNNAKLSNQLSR